MAKEAGVCRGETERTLWQVHATGSWWVSAECQISPSGAKWKHTESGLLRASLGLLEWEDSKREHLLRGEMRTTGRSNRDFWSGFWACRVDDIGLHHRVLWPGCNNVTGRPHGLSVMLKVALWFSRETVRGSVVRHDIKEERQSWSWCVIAWERSSHGKGPI